MMIFFSSSVNKMGRQEKKVYIRKMLIFNVFLRNK